MYAIRSYYDLARKIARLLDDPQMARRMGESGHAMVASRFTADLALERLLAVYSEVSGVVV